MILLLSLKVALCRYTIGLLNQKWYDMNLYQNLLEIMGIVSQLESKGRGHILQFKFNTCEIRNLQEEW